LAANTIDNVTTTAALLSASAFADAGTIVRIRGFIAVELDATAVDEKLAVAVGIASVSTAAAAAGVVSLPTPFTEEAYPWIWHSYFIVMSGAGASLGVDYAGLFHRIEVDSKAMRKVKLNESLVGVSEVAVGNDQGGTHNVIGGIRVLTAK